MSNYTPLTNFGAKDTLPSGNAAKVVRGSEFTIEFNNIASSIATKAEVNAPSFTSDATFGGNIVVNGTVDGRDVLADGNKLDTIETSATADQTDAEIKTAYENNSNTNAFTDADQSKLNAIEASADVTDTANVTTAGAAMLTGASFTGNVSTTGTLATGGFTLPATDGTNGQALLTDGSGAVAWSDVTVDITGKADLSGASFTGNVSTTGTLATGGFTLPATDGTAGQALLTNGSGAVAWGDVTVDISGKANLSGAAFTGDISLDTDAVFLSDLNDFGGKGRIGIGTNNPTATLDMVANNGVSMRFNSLEGKPNVIAFKDTTNDETPVKITATHNDVHYGTNKTGGILTLIAQIDSGGQVTEINNFELRPSYTFSTKPIHVLGHTPPNVQLSSQNSSSHGNFIATADVQSKASLACQLDTQTTIGGTVYEDGVLVAALKLGGSGYIKTTSIRADGEGAIALYNETNRKGVKFHTSNFSPCSESFVSTGGSGTFARPIAANYNAISLGTSSARWSGVYLSNQPDVSSDQRLKENIADADDAGSTIDAIQVRKFDWIESGKHQSYGMIAQELAEVYPEAVSVPENEEDTLGIATGDLIPMLIKEVQSLRSRVAELENK